MTIRKKMPVYVRRHHMLLYVVFVGMMLVLYGCLARHDAVQGVVCDGDWIDFWIHMTVALVAFATPMLAGLFWLHIWIVKRYGTLEGTRIGLGPALEVRRG